MKQESPPPQYPSWACSQSQEYTLARPILPEPPYPVTSISGETFYPMPISMPVVQPDTSYYNPLTEGLLEYRQPMPVEISENGTLVSNNKRIQSL